MTIDQKTERRISRLENDRDDLYEIAVRIDSRVDGLTTEFREFRTGLASVDSKVEALTTEFREFKTEMTSFKTEMLDFKTEVLRRLPAPPEA